MKNTLNKMYCSPDYRIVGGKMKFSSFGENIKAAICKYRADGHRYSDMKMIVEMILKSGDADECGLDAAHEVENNNFYILLS